MAMVGEAILSALFETLFHKLASSDLLKFAGQGKLHAELKKWENILLKIHAVLDDAEEKQMSERLVKIWLADLRDLAYDVEDILDEFATEALLPKSMAETEPSPSTLCRLITSCCISFNPSTVKFNVNMGSKIEEITARLQDISARKNDFHLRENAGGRSYAVRSSRLPTTSLVDESRVYGRETDKEAILNLLLADEPTVDEFCVIPIVGMGGIGKTTLAQLAFNDYKVKDYFDLRAWVCVSDDFDVVRVTKTILQSVSVDSPDANDLNLLQVMLMERISGNKFLLVLDDVWNENCDEWEVLCSPMRAGAPGSKVIITTRNNGVASVAGTCSAYPLQELSHGDCLSLFTQQALGTRSFEAHPHLKELGEEIVRRCKGLPLAAKALGGMLRNELNYDAWVNILKSKIWDLPQERSSVLPALKLSYHHLPSNLKRCFAYCSIFPKDYEFDKDELILLWMAEGFLQQMKEERPEDLGAKYFCDLLSRSFFQQSSYNSSKFVMHDLINDLAHFVAGELCFHLDYKLENNETFTRFEKVRHSSFNRQTHEVPKKFETFHKVKYLRTLVALPINALSPHNFISPKVIHDLLVQKNCLRVLSLSGYCISELPHSIGDLKHLRYLNLSYLQIKRLPDSIGHLYNLQTLILRDCYRLTELPMEIGNLVNLRHLDITDTSQLLEMPAKIGSLTNLQTLSKFIVGRGSCLGIQELKNLLDLQGKLSISGLHNVVDIQDAKDANLAAKQNIEELTMEWSNDFSNARNETEEMKVLESLRPHRNMKKLVVAFYGGSQMPRWIKQPSFPMMTHLMLKNCKICTSLPSLGRLPLLKDLQIEGLSKIMVIGLDFYGESMKPFPSLELLKFDNMPNWKTWSFPGVDEETELFPCLQELSIRKCPKLEKELPNYLPSLVTLDIFECPNLAVPFPRFASLRKLNAEECNKMMLKTGVNEGELTSWWEDGFGLEDLQCLESAVIGRCHWIVSMVEQRLPCNLKILKIKDCANLARLPNGLQSVEELTIEKCPKLVSFPEMGFSPMLRYLLVRDCPSLVCFPESELPPAFKHLEIHHCKNLTSLPEGTMHHNSNNTCCLQVLIIRNCSSLASFPEGKLPSTLKRLEIMNCLKMEQISEHMLQNNEALEELWISVCPGLECLIERGLPTPNLRQLKIVNCKNLKSLPPQMQKLTSLQALNIWNCPGVVSFPAGGLAPNLTSLQICDCKNLKMPMSEWGLHTLTSLLRLLIRHVLPDMVSLSDSECLFPPSLTSLSISHMESLAFLNLQSLTSLKKLSFRGCPKLQTLGLPATVVSLEIKDCPILKERCLKEKREYWPKISHIPCIQMDGSYIH